MTLDSPRGSCSIASSRRMAPEPFGPSGSYRYYAAGISNQASNYGGNYCTVGRLQFSLAPSLHSHFLIGAALGSSTGTGLVGLIHPAPRDTTPGAVLHLHCVSALRKSKEPGWAFRYRQQGRWAIFGDSILPLHTNPNQYIGPCANYALRFTVHHNVHVKCTGIDAPPPFNNHTALSRSLPPFC